MIHLASILAAVIFIFTVTTPVMAQEPPTCENGFGMVEPFGWTFLYPPERMANVMDMMRAAGVDWVRLNWAWKDLQPQEGDFDYSHYDRIAQMADERGLNILPILAAVPAWASTAPAELIAERGNLSPVDRYRAADMDDWLLYVANVVERYDGDGVDDAPNSPRFSHWEVWNEPNIAAFWLPAPDPKEYLNLLIQTRETILAADPTATIVLGGLAGPGVNEHGQGFLPRLYELGAAPYFDIVSIHIYTYPSADAIDNLRRYIDATRAVMDNYGDSEKPIWLTEVGWSDAPNAWGHPTVPPEQIADFLGKVFTTDLGVEMIFWYNFRNIFDASADIEHNFGIIQADLTPKPAYETLTQITCP